MGKAVFVTSTKHIPYDLIGELCQNDPEYWIETYEREIAR